ncbi:PTS system cellobiose-specific IIC component [Anaerosolibacter carboniphilus]|uniref:Permease IIC component n=1 Tax=Anaerosolibacter carboniphilus TaxID=1417629 RepID=A0A841KW61_9FIRM|nr:PTS sugar transporter subunit IIC [Anaerosolibacter carboniphilus]MBB6217874.1 PTS system cellobiose-specific IIC component [Anaerosolibacter carboniphilus]
MRGSFMSFLEEKLMPIGAALGQQKHLAAIRDGIMSTIPLTVIGGLCLIVAFPPIDPAKANPNNPLLKPLLAWAAWASAHMGAILTPFNMTMALMAIFCAFGVAYSLAKSYDLDGFSNAITSCVVFLLVAGSSKTAVLIENVQKGGDALNQTISVLPTTYFDAKGLFTAMLVGLITVEITKFLERRGFTIKMPEGVPPAVARSFNSLIPMAANMAIFYTIVLILDSTVGMNLPQTVMAVLSPAVSGINTIWGMLFVVLFCQLMWFIGIHGAALVGTVTNPIYISNIMANASAKVAGQPLPNIFTEPFWAFYITLAGSGATMALVLMMLRSRSKQLKMVGEVAFLPGLFNINEPVTFGSPIVMNPILGIPFILAPIANLIIAYIVTSIGLVGKAFAAAPWTTPPFIGAGLATMDFKAVLLVFALIAIDYVIYFPFFKMYEKNLIEQEMTEVEAK